MLNLSAIRKIMWNCSKALMLALAVCRTGCTPKQSKLGVRRCAISLAFDYALGQVAGVTSLRGREATMVDARLAVKASHFQCGPVARAAEARLAETGITGVVFHSLGGHYVLLDRQSGLIHDLEAPQGCRNKQELPIWSRSVEMELTRHPEGATFADEVFERYASAWLRDRQNALHCHST